jgi:6-pyruvoyl-tetrahydropterin synthase
MRTTIFVPFEFNAEHSLPVRPEPHQHRYRLTVGITGDVGADGFVVDMVGVRAAIEPEIAKLNGSLLNGHPLFADAPKEFGRCGEHPTCELLAAFFAWLVRGRIRKLKPGIRVSSIEVKLMERMGTANAGQDEEYGHALIEL